MSYTWHHVKYRRMVKVHLLKYDKLPKVFLTCHLFMAPLASRKQIPKTAQLDTDKFRYGICWSSYWFSYREVWNCKWQGLVLTINHVSDNEVWRGSRQLNAPVTSVNLQTKLQLVGSSHCLYFRVILNLTHAEDIFDQFVLKFDSATH